MEIDMNSTRTLLIAAALATTASLGFARTAAAPSAAAPAPASATAPAHATSTAPHAMKRHKAVTNHKSKAAQTPATGASAATK
jgi:hypothetical protein